MTDKLIIPASIIIPTANRASVLFKTLESIACQNVQPENIVIIDASEGSETEKILIQNFSGLSSKLIYRRATLKGAATQRSQGMSLSQEPFVFFMDDDILLQPHCIDNLWQCINSEESIGAVNAMITNQKYHQPGRVTRFWYRFMHGKSLPSYAGMCIGPAWNLLPEDSDTLPNCNKVEWLNSTCALYKREALPDPVFDTHFTGYSLLEDVALSITVSRNWKLYNVRTAKIFHDSQPGVHKDHIYTFARMELINRHYVMTKILGRSTFLYYIKLFIFELWGMVSILNSKAGWLNLGPDLIGKLAAVKVLLFKK